MEDQTAAPVASEPVAAPEVSAPAPSPVESSPRSAIDRAFASVDKADAPEAPAEPSEVKSERQRGPDGKFIASEAVETDPDKPATDDKPADETTDDKPKPTGFAEPPSRFSTDAKAAWKDAPEAVKAEIHRAVRELEQGVEKYRTDAQQFGELKEFADLASRHGTTVKATLENHIRLATALQTDPERGLREVFQYAGISERDFAAKIMGQKPEETQSQADATIRELKGELAALKREVGGVASSIQERQQAEVQKSVETFAAENPRFEELSNDIAFFIKSGRTRDLSEAYALAEKLNPAPQAPVVAPVATHDPSIQTRKGSLSVTGAPGPGSNPANRKPPSSARDALDNAFASVGLG